MASQINWRKVGGLFEIRQDPLTCFQITPDKGVTNTQNYKFFKDIAELERDGMLKNLIQQSFKDGFRIVYKVSTDYIWYEILMKKDDVKFFVVCSEVNKDFVRLKLEQVFPKASIQETNRKETFVPMENTYVADLRLKRHNFFSIRTDYTEQAQPIEDILACVEDLKEEDLLKFSLRIQPFDQNYWSYKAEQWHQQTLRGKAPKRVQLNKTSILGSMFELSELLFNKVGELFRELHNITFKPKTPQPQVEHSTTETREIGEISRQTRYKQTAPVFRTVMRIASHSKDEVRRLMNLKSLSNAFIDLKDSNNSIERGTIYQNPKSKTFNLAYKEVSQHFVSPLSSLDPDYNILCDKELGKIMQMPTIKIQTKYQDKIQSIQRTETEIPEVFLDDSGIQLGYSELKGKTYPIYIPCKNIDEFVLPIIATGIMGSGKDTFAANWVVENALKGHGAIVPDVIDEKDRGMSDAIINALPPEKLVVLDFADEQYTPYLDWSEATKSDNRFTRNRLANELIKFFECEEEAGVQTERYLREAAKALPDGTMIEMGLIFVSDKFREKVIEECKAKGNHSSAIFWEMYGKEGEGRRRQIAAPILNRLHKLVGDPTLKYIFGQRGDGRINFEKWMEEGKVVICKIPKVAFTTTGIRILVHFITVKAWLTKQMMLRKGKKTVTWLVLNEPHQFLSGGLASTLSEIFAESRKFGLGLLTLFHDFSQINKDLADIMINAGSNFVILKQRGDKTWKKFLHRIEPTFTLEDCMDLNRFEAMVGFLVNGKDQPVVRVKMLDLPTRRGLNKFDNKSHVERCKILYGKSIDSVEKEIQEQEKLLYTL